MTSDGSSTYLQSQLVEWSPRIGIAILIIIVTWLVARVAKWTLKRAVSRIPALQRQSASRSGGNVADQLGAIVKLVIWLVGLMAALQFLGLGQILQPVSTLTNEIFAFLPRLIGAGLIFFIGLVVARIVRELLETLIKAADFSGLMTRASKAVGDDGPDVEMSGPSGTTKASIARACGIVVFALIIIPVAIAAVQVLGIDAISHPAVNMLNQILAAIPQVLAAALWLGIAFLAAKLLKNVLEDALPATGFDDAISSTGMLPPNAKPSLLVANAAFVLILLGAGIEASRQIGGNSIAAFLVEVTALGTRVIFGAAIIAAGVFLARILSGLIVAEGDGGFGKTLLRYSVVALSTAIGLRFMGLANEIVILAFGLILGSAALAAGLAFGLGGRGPAERLLDHYATRKIKEDQR